MAEDRPEDRLRRITESTTPFEAMIGALSTLAVQRAGERASGPATGSAPAQPVFDTGRKGSLRAQLQVDDPNTPAKATEKIARAVSPKAPGWIPGEKSMRFDTEGREGPMYPRPTAEELEGAGFMAGPIIGPASRFGKIMAPKLWQSLNKRPEEYNLFWENLDPYTLGISRSSGRFREDPTTGKRAPISYSNRRIAFDPWQLMGAWNRGFATGGPTGDRIFPPGKETAGHEMIHNWLANIYPGSVMQAPPDMIRRIEKQTPGATSYPLRYDPNVPGHNTVFELARRAYQKSPPEEAAGLAELGGGARSLTTPPWVYEGFLNQTRPALPLSAVPTQAGLIDWLMERASSGKGPLSVR